MPEPKVESLALARIIRDLEKLRADAQQAGLPGLAYLLDMALIEARERQAEG